MTNEDCELLLTEKDKGWVCEVDNEIAGRLFYCRPKRPEYLAFIVHPDFERLGIARKLDDVMLD